MRGHTGVRRLDQEAAMRLEQRHTSRRRHQAPSIGRDRGGRRSDVLRIKSTLGQPGSPGSPAARLLGGPGRLVRGKHEGRWGRAAAARHAAIAGVLAVAAAALPALRQLDRLHTHEGGADDGDKKPDKAFHGTGRTYPIGALQQPKFRLAATRPTPPGESEGSVRFGKTRYRVPLKHLLKKRPLRLEHELLKTVPCPAERDPPAAALKHGAHLAVARDAAL